MTMRLLPSLIAAIAASLHAPMATAQDTSTCPAPHIMSPAEVAGLWEATRTREASEGLVRSVDLTADWQHTPSYVMMRSNQDGSNEVSIVRQAGPWRRVDSTRGPEQRSEYIQLETGVRVVIRHSSLRAHTLFEATRPLSSENWRRWRRVESARDETHLGEQCTVSRFDPVEARPNAEHPTQPTEVCLTRDGIELWRRTASSPGANNGTPREFLVAQTLSRESVNPSDVRPPREMLNWDYWRAAADEWQEFRGSIEPSVNPPDHNVCYEYANAASAEIRLTRPWRYQASMGPEQQRVLVSGSGMHMTIVADETGEPWLLTASSFQPSHNSGDTEQAPPAQDSGRQTILRERCNWVSPDHILVAPPMDHCVTTDQIVLATRSHVNRGETSRATYLRRAPLPETAFTPPAHSFDWIDPN